MTLKDIQKQESIFQMFDSVESKLRNEILDVFEINRIVNSQTKGDEQEIGGEEKGGEEEEGTPDGCCAFMHDLKI